MAQPTLPLTLRAQTTSPAMGPASTGLKWKSKAVVQQVCSFLPWGESLNYALQRHLTHSLPRTEEQFAEYVEYGKRHLAVLRRLGQRKLADATFYEFGAGWDFTVPLVFHTGGAGRQLLIDIRPLLRVELVNDTITRLRNEQFRYGLRNPVRGPLLPQNWGEAIECLRRFYGIEYHAPADARQTPFHDGAVDYVTSTNTLEHLPPEDIRAVLRDCYRLLRPGGTLSFRVDYEDHYSYFDRTVSPYNFLCYSERNWRLYNPSLHYQNRLRHSDYLAMYRDAGFEVLDEGRYQPTDEDVVHVSRLPLDDRFKGYRLEDLAVRNSLTALQKPWRR